MISLRKHRLSMAVPCVGTAESSAEQRCRTAPQASRSTSDQRLDRLCQGLIAVGLIPRRIEHASHTSVEAALPAHIATETWSAIQTVLRGADWFGLVDSRARGRCVWGAVRRDDATPGPVAATPLPPTRS
jgi:hypothetical protein